METAVVLDDHNNPLTNGPVPFSRIPIAGDYVRVNGTALRVSAVLFTADSAVPATFVRVSTTPQAV